MSVPFTIAVIIVALAFYNAILQARAIEIKRWLGLNSSDSHLKVVRALARLVEGGGGSGDEGCEPPAGFERKKVALDENLYLKRVKVIRPTVRTETQREWDEYYKFLGDR